MLPFRQQVLVKKEPTLGLRDMASHLNTMNSAKQRGEKGYFTVCSQNKTPPLPALILNKPPPYSNWQFQIQSPLHFSAERGMCVRVYVCVCVCACVCVCVCVYVYMYVHV